MVGIIDPLQKIKTKTSESARESNVDNVDSLQGTIVLLHELELSEFINNIIRQAQPRWKNLWLIKLSLQSLEILMR